MFPSGLRRPFCIRNVLESGGLSVGLGGSLVAVIVGAPTLILGAIAAVSFAATAAASVYAIGDVIEQCT